VATQSFLAACQRFAIDFPHTRLRGYRCEYRLEAYRQGLFNDFGIPFPARLANAVAKRQSSYLAGRICARRLLIDFGLSDAQWNITSGPKGEPIWPASVLGSISHTADRATCVVTSEQDVLGVGIDIERELEATVAAKIGNDIVDEKEMDLIRTCFPVYDQGLTVVFSAKESIYKAAFPLVRRIFDFSAMKLTRIDESKLVFKASERLCDEFEAGAEIQAIYGISGVNVQTVVCLPGIGSNGLRGGKSRTAKRQILFSS